MWMHLSLLGKLQVDTTRSKAPLALRIGAATLIVGAAVFLSSGCVSKGFFTFRAFKIPSASMCPTICEGDRIIVDMAAFRRSAPRHGDIVIFPFDSERNRHIKRVVAVGGDEVSGSHGQLIVNGKPVEPPASACGTSADRGIVYEASPDLVPQRVPSDRLFLVGDNMDHSYDSRYYGTGTRPGGTMLPPSSRFFACARPNPICRAPIAAGAIRGCQAFLSRARWPSPLISGSTAPAAPRSACS